ncbi:MAG TPA: CvpA family protein [Burkholderiales bacterium]|jgi:membrane protein required for colicin V production|nr:CvpA family protein [Burkholderiales bacterium]
MTAFDFVLLLVVALSMVISVVRGLVREVLSLASWIGAFFVAKYGAVVVASWLPGWVSHPGARLAMGFVLVMVAAVLLFSLVSMQIAKVVKITGLQGTDRALGALFGLARGIVIALTAVLLAGMTPLPKARYWQEAMLSAPLETAAKAVQPWLPSEIRSRIRYD